MFRKDPTEKIVNRLANESHTAQLDFGNSEELKQLDKIIKHIEKKIIPAFKKEIEKIEALWSKELHISDEKIKETILKFASDHDVDSLMPKEPFLDFEVTYKIKEIKKSKERTDHLIKSTEGYAKGLKKYDAILSFLNTIKPIVAERHAQNAGHIFHKHA